MIKAEPIGTSRRVDNYRIQRGQKPGKRPVRLTPRQYKRVAKKYHQAEAVAARKAGIVR